jgi:glycerol-3-phosphate dehydrogenase (NAD(P)+)
LGRNRRLGVDIIEKKILKPFKSIDDLLGRINELEYIPEGAAAAKYVMLLAEKHRLKMPIATGLYRILNRELEPSDFLKSILNRLGR